MELGNQKVFADLSKYGQEGKVIPSGLTIDQSDSLYVAMLNGGKILRFDMKWGFLNSLIAKDKFHFILTFPYANYHTISH